MRNPLCRGGRRRSVRRRHDNGNVGDCQHASRGRVPQLNGGLTDGWLSGKPRSAHPSSCVIDLARGAVSPAPSDSPWPLWCRPLLRWDHRDATRRGTSSLGLIVGWPRMNWKSSKRRPVGCAHGCSARCPRRWLWLRSSEPSREDRHGRPTCSGPVTLAHTSSKPRGPSAQYR